MSRASLNATLSRYVARWPEEAARVVRIQAFVARHGDCFERSCRAGHITSSAWVVSADRSSVLLVRHRKLGSWLQLGGHADGEPDTAAVALREAREESGIATLGLLALGGAVEPFDVDIHRIPERPGEPAHLHYDLRYLVAAPDEAEPAPPAEESDEVRWVAVAGLAELTSEESVLRMARKAALLGVTGH